MSPMLESIKNEKQRESLADLLVERSRWSSQEKEAKENVSLCNEAIKGLMDKLKLKNVVAKDFEGDSRTFSIVDGCSVSIDKLELLNVGCTPEQISRATKTAEYRTVHMSPKRYS